MRKTNVPSKWAVPVLNFLRFQAESDISLIDMLTTFSKR